MPGKYPYGEIKPFKVSTNYGYTVVWAENPFMAANYILMSDDECILNVVEVEFNGEQ